MPTGTVRLHRVVKAKPEKVYRAFVEPAALAKWLPPHGFVCKVHRFEAEVGRGFEMSFENFSTGKAHSFGGKYLELVPGQTIRYTDSFDDPNLPGEMLVSVKLTPVLCGTELGIEQSGIPEAIPVEMCYLGWQESLEQLLALVEPEIPGSPLVRPALAAAILAGAALARLDASAMDLSSLWDYSDPQASEQRFRQALATAGPDDALILQTQIARTFGLRGDFAQARRILEGVQDAIPSASAEAQARYLLELGRTYASTAHRPEETSPEAEAKARSLYTAAFEKARDAHLDALAIDALHMMPMVDTAPADQLRWDLKAIAYMESSSQADAKRWEGSLRNNVGYAQHLLGHYDEALREYRLSLAAYERDGRPTNARIAWWMIARTMRAQGRYPEAIDIQRRLEQEWDAAGHPDPDVYEELEQLYRATGDVALADRYAAKLHASTQSR